MSSIGLACHIGSWFSDVFISLESNIFPNLQWWSYFKVRNRIFYQGLIFLQGGLILGFIWQNFHWKVNKMKSKLFCWNNEKCHKVMANVSLLILYLQYCIHLWQHMSILSHNVKCSKFSYLVNLVEFNLQLKFKLLSSSKKMYLSFGIAIYFSLRVVSF